MRLRLLPHLAAGLLLLMGTSAPAQPHLPEFAPQAATLPVQTPGPPPVIGTVTASQPATLPAPVKVAEPQSETVPPKTVPLRVSLVQCDHASGIYYARESARCTLLVENPNATPATLQGEIIFGQAAEGGSQPFKPLSITPLTESSIAPRQRARIEVTGTVGAPGRYELRWNNRPVDALSQSSSIGDKVAGTLRVPSARTPLNRLPNATDDGTRSVPATLGRIEIEQPLDGAVVAGGGGGGGLEVRCIFPPRDLAPTPETRPVTGEELPADGGAGKVKVNKSPGLWVMRLPRAAMLVPGYLADFSARTGISRFVLEDRWPVAFTDAEGNSVPGWPVDWSDTELETLLAQVRAAKVRLIIRVAIPPSVVANPARLTALHAHIAALLRAAGQQVEGIVVTMPGIPLPPGPGELAPRVSAVSFYLAIYDAAKKQDRNIVMLGLGSVTQTGEILYRHEAGQPDLTPYVDALAITQGFGELWQLNQAIAPADGTKSRTGSWPQKPILILPHPPHEFGTGAGPAREVFESPALALAQGSVAGLVGGLKAVPVPDFDRGVTVHLFGQSVFYQRLRPDLPPFLAVFQGNGYAVAAIAGLGAGTPNDMEWPWLETQSRGDLEVPDDSDELRVVDEVGNPVDCRRGDLLRIPLDHRVRYLLQPTGSAEDLLATLRSSEVRGLTALEVRFVDLRPADAATGTSAQLKLQLRNATSASFLGDLRVYLPRPPTATEAAEAKPILLGQGIFTTLSSAAKMDFVVSLSQFPEPRPERLLVEYVIGKETRRVMVPLK